MLKKLYKKDGIIMIFNDKNSIDYNYFCIENYTLIMKNQKKILDKKYHQLKGFTYLEGLN
jgi:hypothetical protein